MLQWFKNLFSGGVKEQIEKMVKHSAYVYLDGILTEGQSKSKDQLDEWFKQQREKVKTWAGE